ncbi:MAG: MarR family winged helix-turn-helix transcriptional regulator [Rhodoferax sp.]
MPPKKRAATLALDDYVPYQLAMLSSRLSRALEAVYGDRYGLARTEWRALALASEVTACSASDLVERSGLDAVAIHRAVKRLELLGYMTRQRVEHDKRLRLLQVTPEGRWVYEAVVPHAVALQDRLLGHLDRTEALALQGALTKLMSLPFEGIPPSDPGVQRPPTERND